MVKNDVMLKLKAESGSMKRLIQSILSYYSDIDCDIRDKKISKNPNIKNEYCKRHYFIPLSIESLLDSLHFIKQYLVKRDRLTNNFCGRYKFLDAGCGIGWVTQLAQGYGYDSYGIDIEPHNIYIAKRLFNWYSGKFEVADITKYQYKDYDVVYYYVPIRDEELESKFEKKVNRELKIGSIVCGFGERHLHKNKCFKRLIRDKPIYEKISYKVK